MKLFLTILLFMTSVVNAISSRDIGTITQTKQQLDLLLEKEIPATQEEIISFENQTSQFLDQIKSIDSDQYTKYQGLVRSKKDSLTLKLQAAQAKPELTQLKVAAPEKPEQKIPEQQPIQPQKPIVEKTSLVTESVKIVEQKPTKEQKKSMLSPGEKDQLRLFLSDMQLIIDLAAENKNVIEFRALKEDLISLHNDIKSKGSEKFTKKADNLFEEGMMTINILVVESASQAISSAILLLKFHAEFIAQYIDPIIKESKNNQYGLLEAFDTEVLQGGVLSLVDECKTIIIDFKEHLSKENFVFEAFKKVPLDQQKMFQESCGKFVVLLELIVDAWVDFLKASQTEATILATDDPELLELFKFHIEELKSLFVELDTLLGLIRQVPDPFAALLDKSMNSINITSSFEKVMSAKEGSPSPAPQTKEKEVAKETKKSTTGHQAFLEELKLKQEATQKTSKTSEVSVEEQIRQNAKLKKKIDTLISISGQLEDLRYYINKLAIRSMQELATTFKDNYQQIRSKKKVAYIPPLQTFAQLYHILKSIDAKIQKMHTKKVQLASADKLKQFETEQKNAIKLAQTVGDELAKKVYQYAHESLQSAEQSLDPDLLIAMVSKALSENKGTPLSNVTAGKIAQAMAIVHFIIRWGVYQDEGATLLVATYDPLPAELKNELNSFLVSLANMTTELKRYINSLSADNLEEQTWVRKGIIIPLHAILDMLQHIQGSEAVSKVIHAFEAICVGLVSDGLIKSQDYNLKFSAYDNYVSD
jgi:hypothetical protein